VFFIVFFQIRELQAKRQKQFRTKSSGLHPRRQHAGDDSAMDDASGSVADIENLSTHNTNDFQFVEPRPVLLVKRPQENDPNLDKTESSFPIAATSQTARTPGRSQEKPSTECDGPMKLKTFEIPRTPDHPVVKSDKDARQPDNDFVPDVTQQLSKENVEPAVGSPAAKAEGQLFRTPHVAPCNLDLSPIPVSKIARLHLEPKDEQVEPASSTPDPQVEVVNCIAPEMTQKASTPFEPAEAAAAANLVSSPNPPAVLNFQAADPPPKNTSEVRLDSTGKKVLTQKLKRRSGLAKGLMMKVELLKVDDESRKIISEELLPRTPFVRQTENHDDSSELLIGHFSKLCDDVTQKSFNEASLLTRSTCPEEAAASANDVSNGAQGEISGCSTVEVEKKKKKTELNDKVQLKKSKNNSKKSETTTQEAANVAGPKRVAAKTKVSNEPIPEETEKSGQVDEVNITRPKRAAAMKVQTDASTNGTRTHKVPTRKTQKTNEATLPEVVEEVKEKVIDAQDKRSLGAIPKRRAPQQTSKTKSTEAGPNSVNADTVPSEPPKRANKRYTLKKTTGNDASGRAQQTFDVIEPVKESQPPKAEKLTSKSKAGTKSETATKPETVAKSEAVTKSNRLKKIGGVAEKKIEIGNPDPINKTADEENSRKTRRGQSVTDVRPEESVLSKSSEAKNAEEKKKPPPPKKDAASKKDDLPKKPPSKRTSIATAQCGSPTKQPRTSSVAANPVEKITVKSKRCAGRGTKPLGQNETVREELEAFVSFLTFIIVHPIVRFMLDNHYPA
jgi:hypothetical protein